MLVGAFLGLGAFILGEGSPCKCDFFGGGVHAIAIFFGIKVDSKLIEAEKHEQVSSSFTKQICILQ